MINITVLSMMITMLILSMMITMTILSMMIAMIILIMIIRRVMDESDQSQTKTLALLNTAAKQAEVLVWNSELLDTFLKALRILILRYVHTLFLLYSVCNLIPSP